MSDVILTSCSVIIEINQLFVFDLLAEHTLFEAVLNGGGYQAHKGHVDFIKKFGLTIPPHFWIFEKALIYECHQLSSPETFAQHLVQNN
jgi:hypothetical protein